MISIDSSSFIGINGDINDYNGNFELIGDDEDIVL